MANEVKAGAMYMVTEKQLNDFAQRVIDGVMSELGNKEQTSVPVEDPMLSYAEVCAMLGVSKQTIWRYQKAGKLTPVHLSTQAVRFRKSEILKLQ